MQDKPPQFSGKLIVYKNTKHQNMKKKNESKTEIKLKNQNITRKLENEFKKMEQLQYLFPANTPHQLINKNNDKYTN